MQISPRRPLRLGRSTVVDFEFDFNAFVGNLQPFVTAVHGGIAATGDLRRAVSSAARLHPGLAQFFDLGEDFGLRPQHLFPAHPNVSEIVIANRRAGTCYQLDASALPVVDRFLELCGPGSADEQLLRQEIDDTFVDVMLREGHLVPAEPRPPHEAGGKTGIVRLQHASVLYRSGNTGILLDPHFHSAIEPHPLGETFAVNDVHPLVDAVLISHSHSDHFSLSTLMLFPRELPIVVPRVPRTNLIGADIGRMLRAAGFRNVIELDWYSAPLQIGEFQVHALPFYGEQPLRDELPRDPGLRNWGNTYYLRAPRYTSWVLVDSGDDSAGRMAQVAEYVADSLGGVDFLLSNLNLFHVGAGICSPNYTTGRGEYWLSLSPSQMARFASLCKQTITLGPRGVAEVARIARARRFLPYAHWWSTIGTLPGTDQALSELERAAEDAGARVEILPWNIGDGYFFDSRNRLVHWRAQAPVGAAAGAGAGLAVPPGSLQT